MLRFYLLLCFFYLLLAQKTLCQTWAELLAQPEKYYQTGNYLKARAKKSAYERMLRKKFKNQDVEIYRIWFTILEARCNEALGLYDRMEAQLQEVQKQLQNWKQKDFKNFAFAQCQIAEVYLQFGYYTQAERILLENYQEITQKLPQEKLLQAEYAQRLAYVLGQKELVKEAQTYTQELEKIWQEAINSKQIDNRKATKNELAYLKSRLADFYTLQAFLLSQSGDYKQADKIFEANEQKIRSLVGSKSMAYINHLLLRGINSIQGEARDMDEEMETAFKKAGKALKKTSKVYLATLYNLIRLSANTLQLERANKLLKQWTSATASFPKNGIYDLTLATLKAEMQLLIGKKEALNILKNLLKDTKSLPLTHPLRLDILDILYEFNTKNDYDLLAAEMNVKERLAFVREVLGENAIPFFVNRILLAEYLIENSENLAEAKKIYEESPQKMVFDALNPQHRDYLQVLQYVSNFAEITDDYTQALQLSKQKLAILKDKYGEQSLNYGEHLLNIANLQLKKGEYRQAEENINQAMKTIRKETSKKSVEYAKALSTAAHLYGIIGLYDEAEEALEKVSDIIEKTNDVTLKMQTIEELAFLYLRMGKYNETEEMLVLDITEKEKKYGKFSRKLISPLNQMSQLQLLKGDYKLAEKTAQRAVNIAEKVFGKSSIPYAEATFNLSKFYAEIGDYQRAEKQIQDVIQLQRKLLGDKHVELANSLTELALIKFYKEKPEKDQAAELLEESKSIISYNFDKKHPLYAEALKNLALLAIEQGNTEIAFNYLKEADKILENKLGSRNKGSAEVALLLGDLYLKRNDLVTSEKKYAQAERIFAKIFSPEHPKYVKTQSKLAQVNYIKNDFADANKKMDVAISAYLKYIKNYFPALSENEKAKFWALIKPDFEFFNSLALKQADRNPEMIEKMYNNILATKAILLSSSIKMKQRILNSKDQEIKDLYKKWIEKKEYLNTIIALSPEQLAEQGINKEQLEKEVEQIEKELSEKSDAFAQGVDNLTYQWNELKKGLAKHEAAIEIVRFRLFDRGFTDSVLYAALIVSQETKKAPKLVLLSNGRELEQKYFKYYRNSVRFRSIDKYSYINFWKPIENNLGEKITDIYLSPDGVYNQVNLESMQIDENTFVIDKFNIRLVSNTKDLIIKYKEQELAATNKKSRRKRKENTTTTEAPKAVLIGSPEFYLQTSGNLLTPLPGTLEEVNKISQILQANNWQSEVFTQSQTDEALIKSLSNPKIFHIATHGLFREDKETDIEGSSLQGNALLNNPMFKVGLAVRGGGDVLEKSSTNFNLEDGILTAAEASCLNFDNTDLVVLSACETGRGDVQVGEGVYGLQRAFLVAGAKCVIMSLFKVNDEITQQLMTTLYQKMIQQKDIRKAFNEAQKEIKSQYKHPIFWGAFNIIGLD
ncbi:MAG: CHAT domain-containing protein [Microscillaceae bacterium]|nr:CHAT domain-containing protein [Microscillaceae bacterium]MDW8461631.1 CHAT domain-containing protein [Cytophagales bacterium]